MSSARRTRHSCAMRSHVDRARLAARDEQEGARAVAARAAAAELGGHRGRGALTLTGTWRPFRRSGNVLNAQGQNAFRQRSERVRISVLANSGGVWAWAWPPGSAWAAGGRGYWGAVLVRGGGRDLNARFGPLCGVCCLLCGVAYPLGVCSTFGSSDIYLSTC